VDFTSHIAPPTKVGDREVMVQVYAVAVDSADIAALDERGVADVGKFIPGRSFVGRLLVIGDDEKDLQRGDLVMGLLDIKKVSSEQITQS
jgi:NADPH:quinone reductase-like Zn-dependent oxidoreductase